MSRIDFTPEQTTAILVRASVRLSGRGRPWLMIVDSRATTAAPRARASATSSARRRAGVLAVVLVVMVFAAVFVGLFAAGVGSAMAVAFPGSAPRNRSVRRPSRVHSPVVTRAGERHGTDAWPRDEGEALRVQELLRAQVSLDHEGVLAGARRVAGLDVAYATDESVVAGAIAVVDPGTGDVVETATATRPVDFPYIPGLLAFREIPALLDALDRLAEPPDVLVWGGYGVAHPRRFGLACHLGVLTGVPAFGVAKTAFVGAFDEPGPRRGDWSALVDAGEVVGRVLRTQDGIKPVF